MATPPPAGPTGSSSPVGRHGAAARALAGRQAGFGTEGAGVGGMPHDDSSKAVGQMGSLAASEARWVTFAMGQANRSCPEVRGRAVRRLERTQGYRVRLARARGLSPPQTHATQALTPATQPDAPVASPLTSPTRPASPFSIFRGTPKKGKSTGAPPALAVPPLGDSTKPQDSTRDTSGAGTSERRRFGGWFRGRGAGAAKPGAPKADTAGSTSHSSASTPTSTSAPDAGAATASSPASSPSKAAARPVKLQTVGHKGKGKGSATGQKSPQTDEKASEQEEKAALEPKESELEAPVGSVTVASSSKEQPSSSQEAAATVSGTKETRPELQASATLFDTVAGTFYGNTCRGKPVLPIEPTVGAEEVSVKGRPTTDTWDFELLDDIYFHSRIADPNCVVVVELSWVWRQDGVAVRSETAGWCTLPLSGDSIVPALASTTLFLGSARSLMYGNSATHAKRLGSAMLDFKIEAYPAMLRASPLLPENFLVTYDDVVPGLRRFDEAGLPSSSLFGIVSSLANPILNRAFTLKLSRLGLDLPHRIYAILQQLPLEGRTNVGGGIRSSEFTARITVHNGRRFLGESVMINATSIVQGERSMSVSFSEEVEVPAVVDDKFVSVVLEILYTGPIAVHPPRRLNGAGVIAKHCIVGWVPLLPLERAGNLAEGVVREGKHTLTLRSGPGTWIRNVPLLNWRSSQENIQNGGELVPPRVFISVHQSGHPKGLLEALGIPAETFVDAARIASPRKEGEVEPRPVRVESEDAASVSRSLHDVLSQKIPNVPEHADYDTMRDNQRHLYSIAMTMQEQLAKLTTMVENIQNDGGLQSSPVKMSRSHRLRLESAKTIQKHFRGYQTRKAYRAHRRHRRDVEDSGEQGPGLDKSWASLSLKEATQAGPSRATKSKLKQAMNCLPQQFKVMMKGKSEVMRKEDINIANEVVDGKIENQIVLQFLAYKHSNSLNSPTDLTGLYFTFQFFDFRPTSSKAVIMGEQGSTGISILTPSGSHSRESLVLDFKVNSLAGGASLNLPEMQDRRQQFCKYLYDKDLRIDVWDSRSHLQLGTASISLWSLLRQGRQHAEILHEVDVLDHNEANPEAHAHNKRRQEALQAALGEHTPQATKGGLFIRAINIGRHSHVPLAPAKGTTQIHTVGATKPTKIVSKSMMLNRKVMSGYVNDARLDKAIGDLNDTEFLREVKDAEKRKMKAVGFGESLESEERIDAQVRSQIQHNVARQREVQKKSMIMEKLKAHIVSEKEITPCFGELSFFEHTFTNNSALDQVFHLRISDPCMKVVSDAGEWRALRTANSMRVGGTEENMIDKDKIFFSGNESIAVPFKFQTLDVLDPGSEERLGDRQEHRKVTVELVTEAGWPVSVLEVLVKLKPFVVDRNMRFQNSEHNYLKHSVRFSSLAGFDKSLRTMAPGSHGSPALYSACNDPSVAVSVDTEQDAGTTEQILTIKCRCGAEAERKRFNVLVFSDHFMTRLVETWQVDVHALRRVDMVAVTGQTSQTSVAFRGGLTTQKVKCFSSHPDEFRVEPDTLTLVAGELSEIDLYFRPLVAGKMDVTVNVVDTETSSLVHTLLVATDSSNPDITKTFEVQVRKGAKKSNKFTYTNAWTVKRKFYLRSTHPWLVRHSPASLLLEPGESQPVGLTFDTARSSAGLYESLLYVSDGDDKIEDCFRIRVNVVPGGADASLVPEP